MEQMTQTGSGGKNGDSDTKETIEQRKQQK